MFRKVLVANRGEIAVRVFQTCSELGIRTVAVYSEADAGALHVRRADESELIGPAAAVDSYLHGERIIEVARRRGAEAIHPGYGFLAENAEFAAACVAAGLVFIGPPASVMRQLGDKRAAKRLARQAGVPVVHGDDGDDQDAAALMAAARRLGCPLLIKAAAGGGGRGMRLVRRIEEFADALESAQREARAAFGDPAVLLERSMEAPRHVEFQVLADAHGQVIHLGERECSVQRRHQKVIEESPSPTLSPAVRERMGAAAVAVMRAAGYVNAGTVEFLVAPDGQFYFLEVNTRLQVEHPVTELVTGLDLVREQLAIAAGQPLALTQAAIQWRGHAIECRVYAEDVSRGFQPSIGRLVVFEPPTGPGLRHDVGVATGDEVTLYYDALLAKLIVLAPERAQCIARSRAALDHYRVLGVTTNLPLLRAVLATPEFQAGSLTTDFLERHGERLMAESLVMAEATVPTDAALTVPERVVTAAAGWRLTMATRSTAPDPWQAGPWRLAGQGVILRFRAGAAEIVITGSRADRGGWSIETPSGRWLVDFERREPATLVVREGDQVWEARLADTAVGLQVEVAGQVYSLAVDHGPAVPDRSGVPAAGGQANALRTPLPGIVAKVSVAVGDVVEAGQPLMVIEAMKMEHAIVAPHGGAVTRLYYAVGERVAAGALLAEVRG